jgi:hypothetical protein
MDKMLGSYVQLRCGISHGGLVSGISGKVAPKFCVFGDSTNLANNLEKLGEVDFIQVSEDFAEYLDKHSLLSELSSFYSLEKRLYDSDIHKVIGQTYWLKKGPMLDLRTRYSRCYRKVGEIIADEKYTGYAQVV